MTGDLESPHFLNEYAVVRRVGTLSLGDVVEADALRAVVQWENGARESVEQLSPEIEVVTRNARVAEWEHLL